MISAVNLAIAELRIPPSDPAVSELSQVVRRLAATPEWSAADLAESDRISRRFELGRGRLHDGEADPQGAPVEAELAVALLLKATLLTPSRNVRLRRLNGLLKAIDQVGLPPAFAGMDIAGFIDAELSLAPEGPGGHATPQPAAVGGQARRVPLTVLFYEGPIARAYLETFRLLGLEPTKIISLVAHHDLVSRRPVGRWLPRSLWFSYAAHVQRQRIHFHARRMASQYADWRARIIAAVASAYEFPVSAIEDANQLLPLTRYATDVVEHRFSNWRDPELQQLLAGEAPGTILFTGGGIVPASLLGIRDLRFIHVHPGFLPQIRGADGMLWSLLLAGQPSASAFYMAPGIDTGDVINARWLPPIVIGGGTPDAADARAMYRAAYAFVDPWVRAFMLRQVLRLIDLGLAEGSEQRLCEGETYYFMHERLRETALTMLFED